MGGIILFLNTVILSVATIFSVCVIGDIMQRRAEDCLSNIEDD